MVSVPFKHCIVFPNRASSKCLVIYVALFLCSMARFFFAMVPLQISLHILFPVFFGLDVLDVCLCTEDLYLYLGHFVIVKLVVKPKRTKKTQSIGFAV